MAFPTTPVIETFTGSNATSPPNANWTNVYNGIQIQSNQATGTTADNCIALWDTATFGADCEAYVTSVTGSGQNLVLIRMTSLNIATIDGYYLMIDFASSPDSWEIGEILNAVATSITSTTTNVASGEKFGIEVISTAIKAYHYTSSAWTQKLSTTDASYGSAGYIGLLVDNTTARLDDFGGGTVTSSNPTMTVVETLTFAEALD